MAKIVRYEVVGLEAIHSDKTNTDWRKLHLERKEGSEKRVNTMLLKAEFCPYIVGDEVEVVEYNGRTEILQ